MAKMIKPRYIAGEEFRRYCEAKELNALCLRCGKAGWNLHDTETQLGMVGMHNDRDGNASDTQTHLLTLSCTNCGTIWTLIRGHVQDWLDEAPAEVEEIRE